MSLHLCKINSTEFIKSAPDYTGDGLCPTTTYTYVCGCEIYTRVRMGSYITKVCDCVKTDEMAKYVRILEYWYRDGTTEWTRSYESPINKERIAARNKIQMEIETLEKEIGELKTLIGPINPRNVRIY